MKLYDKGKTILRFLVVSRKLPRSINHVRLRLIRLISNGFSVSSSITVEVVITNCRGLSTNLKSELQVVILVFEMIHV